MTTTQTPVDLRAVAASHMTVGVNSYEEARAALDKGVGGLFITSWADPKLLTEPGRNINALHDEYGGFEVAIDFEGGRVQRHKEVLGNWPAPREMKDPLQTGREIGASLAKYGITVDFTPVLDVDRAGLDIVGDRSFSTDPMRAAQLAAQFALGLQDAGVKPVFKHFPGHGSATGDTHEGPATTPPLAELLTADLAAYPPALQQVPWAGVMVGHLVVPGLSTGDTPASIDSAAYDLLRQQPFMGKAYTDDLSGMKAITDRMSTPEAVREALKAGADQVLWSSGENLDQAIELVVKSIEAGEIPLHIGRGYA